jgi:hypothetical protein
MSSPIFERLSMASVDLSNAKDGPMDRFANSADNVANAVENFFSPIHPVEAPQESPSLIGRVIGWFSSLPVARAIIEREAEAEPLHTEESAANAIVQESQAIIVTKLNQYVREGEGHEVSLDADTKENVLSYLRERIHGLPESIFTKSLNSLITKLEAINEANNRLDWNKMLRIVQALRRISK